MVTYRPDLVELVVADNGKGFDLSRKYAGVGLRSMRERAEMIGSELQIESAPGQGTHIAARVRPTPALAEVDSGPMTGGEHA